MPIYQDVFLWNLGSMVLGKTAKGARDLKVKLLVSYISQTPRSTQRGWINQDEPDEKAVDGIIST